MNIKLTKDTFLLYAAHHYDNPECFSDEEFQDDLNRFKYIKRIFRKYKKTQHIDARTVRLALNHIILVTNVFGPKAGSELLFFKLDTELYPVLKPFLVYLRVLPPTVNNINSSDIALDQTIIRMLREI